MKILFLSAAKSIHTVRWVNAISERGHEVILVSQKNHQAEINAVSEKVKIIYLPYSGTKGYYLNALALHQIYKKEKCDVVNVHYASGYGTLARMARLPKIILNVWGSDVYDFPYQSKIKERILRKNLAYAVQLASTSHSMARQTEKFLMDKKEIAITPFGVDIQKFKPSKNKENEEFVFGIVKTLSPKYGIDTVIEAFDIFLKKIPENEKLAIRLEIYGQGEQLEELQTLVVKKDLQKQVYFGGYVENRKLPDILNTINVFLLGSRLQSESFGVAAVEAMACGLPVIATKVSGFMEVMEAGKTGFIVSVDNAEEMAEYMLVLCKNEELRKEMGRFGRERVEKLYDWDKNVDQMIKLYKVERMN